MTDPPRVEEVVPGGAVVPPAPGLAYPLRITIGWPLGRQRIWVRDRQSDDVFRMLVHLARPAWCEVHDGKNAGQPAFVIEAERFYTQSRTYRVVDAARNRVGWFEYEAKVSLVEAVFRFYRAAELQAAFRVMQTSVGPRWLARVVGDAVAESLAYAVTRPRYVVVASDGTPVLAMQLSHFSIRRLCIVDRLAGSLDGADERLCLLGLSVVAVSEVTRRRSDGAP